MSARSEIRQRRRAAEKLVGPMYRNARLHPYDYAREGARPDPSCFWPFEAITEPGLSILVALTFDSGHHSSGWFKNSQYERCWHFSVSAEAPRVVLVPSLPAGFQPGPDRPLNAGRQVVSEAELRAWCEIVFPAALRYVWRENAKYYSGVTHLRVFVDEHGKPTIPEGEVYDLVPFADGSSPDAVFRSAGA